MRRKLQKFGGFVFEENQTTLYGQKLQKFTRSALKGWLGLVSLSELKPVKAHL
jgi:hypothetical protein